MVFNYILDLAGAAVAADIDGIGCICDNDVIESVDHDRLLRVCIEDHRIIAVLLNDDAAGVIVCG